MFSCTLSSTSTGFSFGLRFSLSLAEPWRNWRYNSVNLAVDNSFYEMWFMNLWLIWCSKSELGTRKTKVMLSYDNLRCSWFLINSAWRLTTPKNFSEAKCSWACSLALYTAAWVKKCDETHSTTLCIRWLPTSAPFVNPQATSSVPISIPWNNKKKNHDIWRKHDRIDNALVV